LKIYLQRTKTHVDILKYVDMWYGGEKKISCYAKIRRGSLEEQVKSSIIAYAATDTASTSAITPKPHQKSKSRFLVERVSLPFGVVVGVNDRGKLLPMRARLHDFMWW
jgi:hypothetical protein